MKYILSPVLKKAYQNYHKWLSMPTDKRIPIIGDPINFFIRQEEQKDFKKVYEAV